MDNSGVSNSGVGGIHNRPSTSVGKANKTGSFKTRNVKEQESGKTQGLSSGTKTDNKSLQDRTVTPQKLLPAQHNPKTKEIREKNLHPGHHPNRSAPTGLQKNITNSEPVNDRSDGLAPESLMQRITNSDTVKNSLVYHSTLMDGPHNDKQVIKSKVKILKNLSSSVLTELQLSTFGSPKDRQKINGEISKALGKQPRELKSPTKAESLMIFNIFNENIKELQNCLEVPKKSKDSGTEHGNKKYVSLIEKGKGKHAKSILEDILPTAKELYERAEQIAREESGQNSNELDELTNENEQLKQENEEVKNALAEQQKKTKNTESELGQLKEKIKTLNDNIDELSLDRSQLETLRQELKDEKEHGFKRDEELDKLRSDYKQANEENSKNSKDIDSLNKQLTKALADNVQKDQQIQKLLAASKNDKSQTTEITVRLQQESEKLKEQASQLSERLEIQSLEHKKEIKELSGNLKQSQNSIREKDSEIETLKAELKGLNSTDSEKDEIIKGLEEKLGDSNTTIDELTTEIESLNAKIEKQTELAIGMKDEYEKLHNAYEEQENESEKLQDRLEQTQNLLKESLESQVTKNAIDPEKEIQTLMSSIKYYLAESSNYQTKLERLQEEVEQLTDLNNMEGIPDSKRAANTQSINKKLAKIAELKEKIKESNDIKQQLQDTLKTKTETRPVQYARGSSADNEFHELLETIKDELVTLQQLVPDANSTRGSSTSVSKQNSKLENSRNYLSNMEGLVDKMISEIEDTDDLDNDQEEYDYTNDESYEPNTEYEEDDDGTFYNTNNRQPAGNTDNSIGDEDEDEDDVDNDNSRDYQRRDESTGGVLKSGDIQSNSFDEDDDDDISPTQSNTLQNSQPQKKSNWRTTLLGLLKKLAKSLKHLKKSDDPREIAEGTKKIAQEIKTIEDIRAKHLAEEEDYPPRRIRPKQLSKSPQPQITKPYVNSNPTQLQNNLQLLAEIKERTQLVVASIDKLKEPGRESDPREINRMEKINNIKQSLLNNVFELEQIINAN